MIDAGTFAARHLWRPRVGAASHALYVSRVVANSEQGTSGGLFAITFCGRFVGAVGERVGAGHVFRAPRGEASCRRCQRALARIERVEQETS